MIRATRLRDQNKWDLALAALTLSATAVAAGVEVTRWVTRKLHRADYSRPDL
jgi:peroxiredoxin family protein